ncbi:MAG: carbohydrate ABC transporter permease [Clostridia bacterium]|nr:carbohydrate ABC transporter permease [Clostridia bacterium]
MRNPKSLRIWLARIALTLFAVIILLPMVQTFLYSFSSIPEMQGLMEQRGKRTETWMDLHLSPHQISLGQYEQVLVKDDEILHFFTNSVIYAAAILLGQAFVIPAMAFGLSKFKFRGRETLFFMIVMLMLLPFQVTMVPNVLTLRFMGLLETVWAVILPMLFAPFFIFLLRQYMIALPDELLEASSIDGAGPFRSFLWIVLPVCRPVLGAAAALSFAESWNLVEQPLTYLSKSETLMPLSTRFNQMMAGSNGYEFAGAALYILPALLIYLFFQEDILAGIQLTEMK